MGSTVKPPVDTRGLAVGVFASGVSFLWRNVPAFAGPRPEALA